MLGLSGFQVCAANTEASERRPANRSARSIGPAFAKATADSLRLHFRAEAGAEDWNRTSDTSIFSAVLYRLSYLGTAIHRVAESRS